MKQEKDTHTNIKSPSTQVAVIGMSCIFPKANNLKDYWANIKNGVDAITDVPSTHWQKEDYFDSDPKSPDHTYTARGGFIDPVDFDPLEFGLTPNAVEATDTSQLLGLVVAKRALQDAGYGENNKEFNRNRASVILGVTGALELVIPLGARLSHPVWRRALKDAGVDDTVADDVVERISDSYVDWQENSFPGLLGNVTAGRIANRLDFRGTNCVVDAACASSLSALHMALMELTTGRSDMVITGGLDTFNDIFMYMCFSKTMVLSPTGDAKPFDRKGDGTILGEGLGMLVLKRLDDAKRDNDNIYAIIRGVGTSSDGKGNAVYVPSSDGQARAIRNAYEQAGITPDTIELVEAHGTGTKVGDASEVNALTDVYRSFRNDGTWCALGSVKSQIGHTKAAAGIAGLIKVIMALRHKVLPPTIKVENPVETISEKETPFYINTEPRPWLPKDGHSRRAAVSAFGFGGSNFHCVVEEYDKEKSSTDWNYDIEILCFSDKEIRGLKNSMRSISADFSWEALAESAAKSRTAFSPEHACRLVAVIEKGKSDVKYILNNALEMLEKQPQKKSWNTPDGAYFSCGNPNGKLGIVFPGQGAQYVGMQRELSCQFPEMQNALTSANRMFAKSNGTANQKELSDYIYPFRSFDQSKQKINEDCLENTEVAQPAIGAVSLGMFDILTSFGVRSDVLAGHSYGELTALCAASCFDPQTFFKLSHIRGELTAKSNESSGTMIAVWSDSGTLDEIIKNNNIDLVLANKNAPNQTVLSGALDEINKIVPIFTQLNIRYKQLSVSSAFHSPFMAKAIEPFRKALRESNFKHFDTTVFANTTAQQYPDDPDNARKILAEQLVSPVEFVKQIENMYELGVKTFLEVGPGNKLSGLIKSILADKEHEVYSMDASSGKRSGIYDLASTLARLAVSGFSIKLAKWNEGLITADTLDKKDKKPSMAMPICGANYVKPKNKRPAKPAAPVAESNKDISDNIYESNPEKINKCPNSLKQIKTTLSSNAAELDKSSIKEMFRITNENMVTLQNMQERTAKLHKQFLDNQETSLKSIAYLMEQQRQLIGLPGTVGGTFKMTDGLTLKTAAPEPGTTQKRDSHAIEKFEQKIEQDEVVPEQAVPASPEKSISSETDKVRETLLDVVSEKTGYPVEMLELDMSLDSDLGIDSIKRVEILSALQDKLPNAPEVKPEHMGVLGTLRQIIEFLSETSEPEIDIQEDNTVVKKDKKQVQEILLNVVSEKTGYPVEMIDVDMGLDTDLGIDSIKKVEILSVLQDRLSDIPEIKPEHMGTLNTLNQIIEFIVESSDDINAEPDVSTETIAENPDIAIEDIKHTESFIARSVLCCRELNGNFKDKMFSIERGSEIWITDDGSRLPKEIKIKLQELNYQPVLVSLKDADTIKKPEKLGGLILVSRADPIDKGFHGSAFKLLQTAAAGLRNAGQNGGSVFVTITRLDGEFGLNGLIPKSYPISGGLAGLAKTARLEWPEVHCKALDIAVNLDDSKQTAAMIVEEVFTDGLSEVGISKNGRTSLTLKSESLTDKDIVSKIGKNDVIVVVGGARGVTAKVSLALAKTFKPALTLLGRSKHPEKEPDWVASLAEEADLKRAILAHSNNQISPKQVEDQYRAIMANREILNNINGIKAAGAQVLYHSIDIRDTQAVELIISDICKKLGPVKGLIYGAGVLADRLIEEKTSEQFDNVYTTKVSGLLNLLNVLEQDELKFIALFSSFTGRHGRIGQSDYAVANEVLNKIAQQQSRLRPSCRVVSVNWGPWDGGMVTPLLKNIFKNENIELINPEAGANYLIQEMCAKAGSPVEVVVMGGNGCIHRINNNRDNSQNDLTLAFEFELNTKQHPFLLSHVIDNRAVLPMAMIIEWAAQSALHLNPGLFFYGFNDLRLLKGVTLEQHESCNLCFFAGKAVRENGLYMVPVELQSTGAKNIPLVHARAQILLVERIPDNDLSVFYDVQGEYNRNANEIYNEILFHGKDLQGIEQIENCGEKGISAIVRSAPTPDSWIKSPLRSRWLADPLAIDCSFQLMILWCFEKYQAGSLPCYAGQYRQHKRVFPADGIRIVIHVKKSNARSSTADIDFIDNKGECVAQIKDYESIISSSLNISFRKNRLN